MTDVAQLERDLKFLWDHYRVRPTHVAVSDDNMEHLAKHRPGGGNSHQRRKWYRMWSPTRFSK